MSQLNRPLPRAGPFPLRQVLVLTDLSAGADNAAWRAGLLAREHGAWLRVVHAGPWYEAREPARGRLDALAWQLQEHLGIAVVAQSLGGGLQRELEASATQADLVVTRAHGAGQGRGWAAGLSPQQLARLSGRPVLVVRKAAAVPYRRVLAGVRHDADPALCIAAASGMAGGPHQPLLAEFGSDRGMLPMQPGFEQRARAVEARIWQLAQADPGTRMKEAPCVVFTRSLGVMLEQERSLFPDLVVLPADGPGCLVPSLSRRLLARTAADLLIVAAPPPAASPTPGWDMPAELGAHGAKVWPL